MRDAPARASHHVDALRTEGGTNAQFVQPPLDLYESTPKIRTAASNSASEANAPTSTASSRSPAIERDITIIAGVPAESSRGVKSRPRKIGARSAAK